MKKKKVKSVGPKGVLSIALAKGYLFEPAIQLLQKAGIKIKVPDASERELSFMDQSGRIRFLVIRPTDVPVYVAQGAVDLGIAGKDVLEEGESRVAELVDLQFGGCQLILAVPDNSKYKTPQDLRSGARIATKFPHLAEQYFSRLEKPVEIVKLYGSVELAPSSDLADAIVDLTATGHTLQKMKLRVLDVIKESTARLIANPVRLKVKYKEIWELCSELSARAKSKKK